MKNKRAQTKMSFNMIFTLFLIAVFLAFAFFGIREFIYWTIKVKIEKFQDDLDKDIGEVWSDYGKSSQTYSYDVPNRIIRVCFKEEEKRKIFELYYKNKEFPVKSNLENIKKVNFEKTLEGNSEICFDNGEEDMELILKKGENEEKVTIGKPK